MIYLDNSATTAPSPRVIAAMTDALSIYGNPSSVHSVGYEAEKLLRASRETILASFGIRRAAGHTIVFTGCGSEADNLAVFGTVKAKNFRFTPRIVTTDSEHPAILRPLEKLEEDGFDIVRLPTRNGVIDREAFDESLNERVVLATFMSVNNETGAVYDLKPLFSAVKKANPNALTHTDAVQAYMKIRILPEKLGADLVSVAAHKINGPKGVGALYIAPDVIKKKQIVPVLLGGGQEGGFRSGTENVPGIVGFAEAVRDWTEFGDPLPSFAEKRAYLLSCLPGQVRVNTPAGQYLPSIVSLTLPSIRSEVMLRYLSEKGICVSAGSACASHHKGPSGALLAFGLNEREADSTIRVSFDRQNTEEDLFALASALNSGLNELARVR